MSRLDELDKRMETMLSDIDASMIPNKPLGPPKAKKPPLSGIECFFFVPATTFLLGLFLVWAISRYWVELLAVGSFLFGVALFAATHFSDEFSDE